MLAEYLLKCLPVIAKLIMNIFICVLIFLEKITPSTVKLPITIVKNKTNKMISPIDCSYKQRKKS